MRPMTTWHRLGDKPALLLQVPTVFKLDRWSVAVFHHDGRFRAIGNACNHKGGPLSEGRLHGEFVMCPWHAWEYSVLTGKGPEGYDEEQVPVFAVEEREDGVYVQTPPVMPRKLVKHKPSHLLEVHPKPGGAPLYLALRHHRARSRGSAHGSLRRAGALGRRGLDRHAHSLGECILAVLQNDRAFELRAEPGHDPGQSADQE